MVSDPSSGWVTLRALSRLRGRHLRPSIRYSCVVGLVAHRRCTLCGPPAAQSIFVRVAACCVDAHYPSLYTFIRFTTVPVAKVGVSTRVLDTHTRHIRHKPHSRFPGCAELPLHLTPCCDAGEVCTPGRQARGVRSSTLRRERRVARRHVKRISAHALPPSAASARETVTRDRYTHT